MSDLRDQLDEIADAHPPPTGAVRDREIQQAITRGLATPARARRVWPWIAIGTSLAAAAAIAIVVVRIGGRDGDGRDGDGRDGHGRDGSGPIAIAGDAGLGANDAAPDPSHDAAPDPVDDVIVHATPDTKYKRDGASVRLDEGELAVSAQAIEVTTPEARILVDSARLVGGARFVVGRYANETRIVVEVGEVFVTPADGEPVTVHAGETWPPEKLDVVVDAGGALPKRDAGVRVPVLQFDATIIRKTIRAGKVGDAREMIEAGRSTHASSKRAMAELGILAAEADLAERKTKSAIGKYLDVVRDYATTAQAEQALFAAAQLAIDRPDAGYKAEALLRDYLDTYPEGQFAKDAARLLDTLKK